MCHMYYAYSCKKNSCIVTLSNMQNEIDEGNKEGLRTRERVEELAMEINQG